MYPVIPILLTSLTEQQNDLSGTLNDTGVRLLQTLISKDQCLRTHRLVYKTS